MKLFLHNLVSTWWGISLIVIFSLTVLIFLSALFYRQFFKRFYDILLSGIGIIVLSPLLLILTILGTIKMKGTPFFIQIRPGRNEKLFYLIKFRTMTCETDENGNLLPDEKRLIKYGEILRATSLDELPELFNIFLGHMSIVGPRPQLVRDMVFMSPDVRKRHSVHPGLTGLAQCSGRNSVSWEQKFEYDLKYIENITLWGDIVIMFKTVFKVLKKDGITEEGAVTSTDLGDYLLAKGEITQEEYDSLQVKAKELINV